VRIQGGREEGDCAAERRKFTRGVDDQADEETTMTNREVIGADYGPVGMLAAFPD